MGASRERSFELGFPICHPFDDRAADGRADQAEVRPRPKEVGEVVGQGRELGATRRWPRRGVVKKCDLLTELGIALMRMGRCRGEADTAPDRHNV